MKKIIASIVISLFFCGVAQAEKYELSKDQQQYLLQVLARADIKGSEAPMLLQSAQAIQKPVVEGKEEPKEEKK